MGEMTVLNVKGDDTVLQWGNSEKDIEMARKTFEQYKREGYTWFSLDDDDEKGERINSFNPNLEGRRIVAVPQMKGG